GTLPTIVEPPPPALPTAPAATAQQPVRMASQFVAAKLIYGPKPVFPSLARQARIQGTVHLEAIISKEGAIENLSLLSGHPLLANAAVEAVKQWRYEPTLLNGAPVEVITTVDVIFTLGQ